MTRAPLRVAGALGIALAVALVVLPSSAADDPAGTVPVTAAPVTVASAQLAAVQRPALPLAGVTIALDPGHQLGNHNFPRQINRLVPAGGFEKPCNTTGTQTNGGYPEATVNWQLANLVRARLQRLGAKVALTRRTNSQHRWGPCVNVRGRFAGKVHATLMVSLHADGAGASDHGFHVIAPASRPGWTRRIARPSLRLARQLRSGLLSRHLARSNYIHNGLDIRSDLGTLNLSSVPVAMVEIGNMRNRADAARMTSARGRATYAAGLVIGVRRYLHR